MARVITPDVAAAAALEAMSGPFGWDGASDCAATSCEAFRILTGVDLMRALRGQYGGRASAVALVRARGGFRLLWEAEAARSGLTECACQPGAVGIIKPGQCRVLALCIRPGLWAAKSNKGAVFTATVPEICWNA